MVGVFLSFGNIAMVTQGKRLASIRTARRGGEVGER